MVWDALQMGLNLLEIAVVGALLLLCLGGVALLLHHFFPRGPKNKRKN